MSTSRQTKPVSYYLSSRDLLTISALAALGGVASTYVQILSTALRATVGFAGGAQFLAGIHVVWLVLAAGLTGRVGGATIAGVLKGVVEFLAGNPHGVLVILISAVAGLLVDVSYWALRRVNRNVALCLGGALGAAANVYVFQLFAVVPADILAVGAMLLAGAVAMASGVVLGGLLAIALLRSLVRAGVARDRASQPLPRYFALAFYLGAAVLAVGAGAYLLTALKGPPEVAIGGEVASPYKYAQLSPPATGAPEVVEVVEREKPGLIGSYRGSRLRDILKTAQPKPGTSALVLKATDGYDFFVTLDEVQSNDSLILARVAGSKGESYSVVGAANSKAWVRNVASIEVVARAIVETGGSLQRPFPFVPDEWQKQMDNATLDLGSGAKKHQGVPLGAVIERMSPAPDARTVVVSGEAGIVELPLAEVQAKPSIRLYSYAEGSGLAVALADEGGKVYALRLRRIDVR